MLITVPFPWYRTYNSVGAPGSAALAQSESKKLFDARKSKPAKWQNLDHVGLGQIISMKGIEDAVKLNIEEFKGIISTLNPQSQTISNLEVRDIITHVWDENVRPMRQACFHAHASHFPPSPPLHPFPTIAWHLIPISNTRIHYII